MSRSSSGSVVGLSRVGLSVGLVLGLTAALLVGSASPSGAVAGYGDVPGGGWYTDAVQWSVDSGITGVGGFCFGPDDPVSRGETAVWIHNMENRPDVEVRHSFSDVTDASQDDAVSWMANTGITTGTSPTTFAPDETLRRAQVATFLHRLAGEPSAPPHNFRDVAAGWQQDSVSWMAHTGITTGTSPTTFAPEDTLTRAQLVTFLYRYQGEPRVSVNPDTPICDPAAEMTNRAPKFATMATLEAPENTTAVGTVTAVDDDAADTVTGYAITGGADRSRLSITSAGRLSFNTAPDYERPADTDQDNNYEITVTATSGTGTRAMTATQSITVTVTDGTLSGAVGLDETGRAHNVIVRVVVVNPEQWHSFDVRGGWPAALETRESDSLKYFEVAIWEEIDAVHFYEFDNGFDPHQWNIADSDIATLTANRESYVIQRNPGLPEPWSVERSEFIRQAFASFTADLVSRYPESLHHLVYNGHGAPGGALFEAQLSYEDASGLLAHWTSQLDRRLGVIDMGGPCNKGSFSDLENFCKFAQYYVASDLPNGGFRLDDWTLEKIQEINPDIQYHRLFADNHDLREVLIDRIDLVRKLYNYSTVDMIANKIAQANYLYSCEEFSNFSSSFWTFLDNNADADWNSFDDLYSFMVRHNADEELLRAFDSIIVHRADNRDFFEWDGDYNGILMPRVFN